MAVRILLLLSASLLNDAYGLLITPDSSYKPNEPHVWPTEEDLEHTSDVVDVSVNRISWLALTCLDKIRYVRVNLGFQSGFPLSLPHQSCCPAQCVCARVRAGAAPSLHLHHSDSELFVCAFVFTKSVT